MTVCGRPSSSKARSQVVKSKWVQRCGDGDCHCGGACAEHADLAQPQATDEEIGAYLATIGAGYTRKLREATGSEDLIGLFGLGFLSAFVVSDKVRALAKSEE